MNKKIKKAIYFIFVFFSYFFLVKNSFALTFDLIPPSEQLQRGQEVRFTINIDTQSKSYSSVEIGMTYDTQYLEFISVTPGDTFSTVSSQMAGDGKMIIKGTNNTPYSGSGVFAYVTFKLIASSPGSTELCALFNPEITPTPTKENRPSPLPTAIYKLGETKNVVKGFLIGITFFALAGGGLLILKNG